MAKKNARQRRKEAKGESAQSFLPIRDIRNGMVETTDGRYLKILEIEPINFALRSSEEQFNIISSFASWLKISPVCLQCKTITRRADSDKHIALVKEELAQEDRERALCANACLLARALERDGQPVFPSGRAVLEGLRVEEIVRLSQAWGEFNRRYNPSPQDCPGEVEPLKKDWSTRLISAFNGVCSGLLGRCPQRRGPGR